MAIELAIKPSNKQDRRYRSATVEESNREGADPRRIPQPEQHQRDEPDDQSHYASRPCCTSISIHVNRVRGTDGKSAVRVPLTYDHRPDINSPALRAHHFVLQARIHVVPEHATDVRAKDKLELAFGVGSQLVAVADISPMGRDFGGFGS